MGFFRREYWSGLPFPSPGVELRSPTLQADTLSSQTPGKSPRHRRFQVSVRAGVSQFLSSYKTIALILDIFQI